MTAPATAPEELAVAWLLARAPAGRVRVGPGVPTGVAAGLVQRGQTVLVDDPDAVRGEVATPWLVRAPDDVTAEAAILGIGELPTDLELPLLTVARLGGDGGLTPDAVDRLFGPAPWRCADEHLVAGTGVVLWVAAWQPDEASGQLASLLTHRLADATTVLAVGTRTVADEVQRLSQHARNLEAQWTAARQGAQLAERMHGRLAREIATAAESGTPPAPSPVDRLRSVVRSVRSGDGGTGAGAAAGPPPPLSLAARLPARSAVGAPFRVGIVGTDARAWLGGWIRAVVVDHGWRGTLVESGRHLEVLVVSEDVPGWSTDELRALLDEARAAGLKSAGVRAQPAETPWFDGLVDVEVVGDPGAAGAGRLVGPRPADPTVVNPLGWRRLPPDTWALVAEVAVPDTVVAAAREALGPGARLAVTGDGAAGDVPRLEADGDGRLATLRGVRAVIDHPALHRDAAAQAAWIGELCLAAVPVLCLELPETVRALLGERLAGILARVTAADLEDPDERERITVVARRAAWLAHTTEARWRQLLPRLGLPVPRRRSFSLVLATNRPDFLDHCVAQAAKQRWSHAELVVGLHGTDFPDDAKERIHAGTDLHTTIVPVEADQPLGEVLNRACQAASGDVVTKWDDDDWYSPDHLVDLAMALDYSGAQLVGKAAEFVYLADLDLTTRRFTTGAETASRTIAGGTMAMAREDLRAIGWWPHVPRSVDQLLIDALRDVGGSIHRTHGFGYILNRHGVGHTWNAAVDYFLQQSESQRRGLDLVFAGVDDRA